MKPSSPGNPPILSFASLKKSVAVLVSLAFHVVQIVSYPFKSLAKDTIESRRRNIRRVRRLAWWLDAEFRIPFGFRIGLDPIITTIPVIGWLLGFMLSFWIVFTAWRFGIDRVGLLRMLMNVGLDSALGSIPFIGSLGAIAWKGNLRNARILEEHLSVDLLPEPTQDKGWLTRLFSS